MNNENKPVYFTKDQLKQHLTSRGITDNAKAQPVVDGLIARGAVIEGINETPNLAQSIAGSFIKPATDIVGTGFAGLGALGKFAGQNLGNKLGLNESGNISLSDAYAQQTQQVQESGANSIVKPLTGQQIRPAQSLEQLGGDLLQTAALAIPAGAAVKGASTAANIGKGLGYGALAGGTFGVGSQMSENATLEDVIKGGLFGAALGGAVGGVLPAIPAIYGAAKKAPAVVTDVFTGAKGLRSDIQTYLGKQNVAPQLETSVNRLTGTASRMESPTALYNEYFPLAEKALTDIKVDAPISKIGSEIGDAFKSVIDNKRAVGAVMGQELKTVGKLKTDIEPIFVNFETALNEAGLTYNGLTKKMVASDLAKVAPEDIKIIEDFVGELNRIGSKPSVAQIDALISRVTDKINYAKSASGMTSTTNGERLVKATLNSLRNTFDEIPELANYAKARKTYSELSDFIDEGSGFLGKVTQSGDFSKDASLAKSAVQSILNNGKKDWLLKLEGLTDYPALDKSTLALQAMKDAGDFRGLSLLETLSDGAKTMTPSGLTSRIFDWAIEKGASKVGGTPAERTRAFLQALESNNRKITAPTNMAQKVSTPASGLKINPTTKAIKKSSVDMPNTIPQKVKGASKVSGKLISNESYQETLKEFKKNMGNMNSGIDPAQLARATKLALYHVQEGVISAAELATRLAKDGVKLAKSEFDKLYKAVAGNSKVDDNQYLNLLKYSENKNPQTLAAAEKTIREIGISEEIFKSKKDFDNLIEDLVIRKENVMDNTQAMRQGKAGVTKELQPLAEEARKHKSAEDFINNSTSLKERYDWGYLDEMEKNLKEGYSISNSDFNYLKKLAEKYRGKEPAEKLYRAGSLSKSSMGDKLNDIYLTDNKGLAEQYGSVGGTKVGEYTVISKNPLDATKSETLKKILGEDWRGIQNDQGLKQKLIKYAKDNNYDSVRFPDSGPDGEGTAGNSLVVFSKDQVKTKQQLIDLWNKANGKN